MVRSKDIAKQLGYESKTTLAYSEQTRPLMTQGEAPILISGQFEEVIQPVEFNQRVFTDNRYDYQLSPINQFEEPIISSEVIEAPKAAVPHLANNIPSEAVEQEDYIPEISNLRLKIISKLI